MNIALIPGRFQPLTTAHADMIGQAMKDNDVVYVYVIGGGTGKQAMNKQKNPIPLEKRIIMIDKSMATSNTNLRIRSYSLANLDHIGDQILEEVGKSEKHNLYIYAGTDRGSYFYQLPYINTPEKSNGKSEYMHAEMRVIKRTGEDISATKVRDAIIAGDKETFMSMTPPAIHDEFTALQGYMTEESYTIFDDILASL